MTAGSICLRCAGERAFALGSGAPFADEVISAPPDEGLDLTLGETGPIPGRIGSFEIIEELGRGGMGRVFAARQSGLGRIVALKILPTGRDAVATELELRFLREAQTVARLRHPHIITVHDSGRASGHVYFSMDYVEGGDLARRLRERPFTPAEAATVLEKVARALAHAHGEGVLHRDLKPSNILLDGAEPRLADFGLALELESSATLTRTSTVLGTPHYLAPEALQGGRAALSTGSDLYALGTVLYELLTGRTPFAGASPAELPALMNETEPPSPRLLAPAVPRDLETICLKCLEREPGRRYRDAAALARDLQHFLAGEPIAARPPGRLERLLKFTRRHRVPVAAGAVAAAALLAGTAVSAALAIRATRAERRAATEAAISREVVAFLQNDLLAQASPYSRPEPDAKLRPILDAAAKKVEGRFAAQPLVEATIRETLGFTFNSLGEHAAARVHFARALALRTREQGPGDRATLHAASHLAYTLFSLADYAPAENLARPTVARQVALLGADHAETLQSQAILAGIYNWQGRLAAAEALYRDTLARQERTLGLSHLDTLETMGGLSSTLLDAGRFAEAEALLRRMHQAARGALGSQHPYTLLALNNLAGALWSQGQFAAAGAIHRENLELTRRILGPEHPDALRFATNLARAYAAEGRSAEAAALHADTLAIRRRIFGDDYHDTLRSLSYLAGARRDLGELEAAAPLFAEALARARRVLGPEHPDTLQGADDYADVLLRARQFAAAEPLLRESVSVRARLAPADWRTSHARVQLGAALLGLLRPEEAAPWLTQGGNELLVQAPTIPLLNQNVVTAAVDRLVAWHAAAGRPEQAEAWQRKRPRDAARAAP